MSSHTVDVLCFFVGERVFAVDIMGIREILRSHSVTPVPTAPAAVAGVLNLRGELVPVINLHRVLLGMTADGDQGDSKLVVVRARGRTAGLQVDQVLEVVSVSAEELRPLPGGEGTAGNAVAAAFRRELDGAGSVVVLLLRLAGLLEQAGMEGSGGSG